nr:TonB-dependent receptor [Sphingomonas oleivorans]
MFTRGRRLGASCAVIAFIIATPASALAQASADSQAESGRDDEIVVSARYANRDERSDTALKVPTDIKELPMNVGILTENFLKDINAQDLNDAIEFVSAVNLSRNFSGVYDQFTIRGQFVDQVNGYRLDGSAYVNFVSPDFSSIEAIEVLKGPVSTLYGRGIGGGVINFVSKKPLKEAFAEASLQFGSFDQKRGTIDVSIPLSSTFGVRFSGAIGETESATDVVQNEKSSFYAVARWEPTENTSLMAQYTLQQNSGVPWNGLPLRRTSAGKLEVPDELPRHTFVGADWNNFDLDFQNVNLMGEQVLGDNLRLKLRGSYTYLNRAITSARGGSTLDSTNSYNLAGFFDYADGYDNYSTEVNLVKGLGSDGQLGSILLGADYSKLNMKYYGNYDMPLIVRKVITDRNYSYAQPDLRPNFFAGEAYEAYGTFVQATVKPIEKLTLLGGMRYDWFENIYDDKGTAEPRDYVYDVKKLTYRVGASYAVTDEVSLYSGYSTGFDPSFAINSLTGEPMGAETARNIEVGAKGDLFGGRLTVNTALFHTRRKNVPVPNPDQIGSGPDTVLGGEQTFKGFEIDVAASLVPGWDLYSSFAVLDAKDEDGNTPRLVPDWSGSFFSSYAFQAGPLENFGVAIGARFSDGRPGNAANSYFLRSYDEWQAQLFYRAKKFDVKLSVDNAFNNKSIVSSEGGTLSGLTFNEARSVVLTAVFRM